MSMFKQVDDLALKSMYATGAAANTNIAVTGITTDDTIICALELSATHYLPTDQTRRCSITSAGYIQCTKTTATDTLWVLWHDASSNAAIDAPCLKFNYVNGAAASTNMAVTGIATEDTLLAAIAVTDTTAEWADDLDQCSITSAGYIQSTTDLSTKSLILIWHDASGQGKKMSGLRFTQAAGAAALRNIRVPGITTSDVLLAVLELAVTSGVPTDRTSEASISSNGNIQLSTTSTATDQLIVIWQDVSQDRPAYNGSSIQVEQVTGSTATTALACPDIRVDDTILWAIMVTAVTGEITNLEDSDTITIPAEGYVAFDTTDTSSNTIIVGYQHAESFPDVNEAFNNSVAGLHAHEGKTFSNFDGFDFICGALCTGAAADTAFACTSKARPATAARHALPARDIATEDTIIMALEVAVTSSLVTDRTKETYISADGYVKCKTDTSSDYMLILWHCAGGGAYNPSLITYDLSAGAGASSDITVTGITTSDRILLAIEHAATSFVPTDRTDTMVITDTNDVQSTDATTGDTVSFFWYDVG